MGLWCWRHRVDALDGILANPLPKERRIDLVSALIRDALPTHRISPSYEGTMRTLGEPVCLVDDVTWCVAFVPKRCLRERIKIRHLLIQGAKTIADLARRVIRVNAMLRPWFWLRSNKRARRYHLSRARYGHPIPVLCTVGGCVHSEAHPRGCRFDPCADIRATALNNLSEHGLSFVIGLSHARALAVYPGCFLNTTVQHRW